MTCTRRKIAVVEEFYFESSHISVPVGQVISLEFGNIALGVL